MIEVAMALTLQVALVAPPVREEEVIVTARRLEDWRGQASADAKGSRCRTIQSTGDGGLDQVACDSMRFCMAKLQPGADAAGDRRSTRPTRKQRAAELNDRLAQCISEQHGLRVADLIERRAAARIRINAQN